MQHVQIYGTAQQHHNQYQLHLHAFYAFLDLYLPVMMKNMHEVLHNNSNIIIYTYALPSYQAQVCATQVNSLQVLK